MKLAVLPTPVSERRGALRHPVRVAGLLQTEDGVPLTVTLTDISEHGCQIARAANLAPGAPIMLAFGGFPAVPARIVWTSPDAYGLQFEQAIHPALVMQVVDQGRGRRKTPRLLGPGLVRREDRGKQWHMDARLTLTSLADAGVSTRGTLADLSIDGCRVVADVAFLPGCPVSIALEGWTPIAGTVRWSDHHQVGIQFDQPLDSLALGRLADDLRQGLA